MNGKEAAEVIKRARALALKPNEKVFQEYYEDGKLIQTSPGRYECVSEGYFPARNISIVRDGEPEDFAHFENTEDAANYIKMVELLQQLADIADKRGAMLMKDRVDTIMFTAGFSANRKNAMLQAAKELDMEASHWTKIGPEEVTDLEFIHRHIEKNIVGNICDDDLNQQWIRAANALRRLLQEE